METQNLEWLIFNALHGDVSGDIPEDLQVMIKAEQEFHALLARVARLEEFVKKAEIAFDEIGAVNWSRRACRALEEK